MKVKRCAGCKKAFCDDCKSGFNEKLHTSKTDSMKLPVSFTWETSEGLGIAYDLGTTTVAASLWDLESGRWLGTESCMNPQREFGNDVISRITYCMEKDVWELQEVIVSAMDELAQKLILPMGKKAERVTVAGNTVMCGILAGLSMNSLAKAPFEKGYRGCIRCAGSELGFGFLAYTEIIILPAIESYVGADALSVYAYIKEIDRRKNVLAVDVGTNGEIILIGSQRAYVCSAAAGPALEGAAVCQGMSALPGAISRVGIVGNFPREDVYCEVIGKCSPIGICGSGLVDVLALLCEHGIVDENGYLRTKHEAAQAGVKERFCQRIYTQEGENKFLLTDTEHPVFITAKDIRQLQLAKGAIRAGIEILLKKAQIKKEEISCLYLAGAFGNYISEKSAVRIRLLPDIDRDRIVSVGNGAGMGAAMALLSEKVVCNMEKEAEKICHVELAKEQEFQELFMKYTNL